MSKALDIYDYKLLYMHLDALGSKFHEVISTIVINLGGLGTRFFSNAKVTTDMTVMEFIRYFERVVFSTFWDRASA